jgi:phospholipid/cholesterol/gamma-HCH transport system substrate-binding protein
MTSFRGNLVAVGTLVLAALGSLLLVLAILAGRTGATDHYYTIYDNVTGLKYGSQVFYEGYAVGQVERIEPDMDSGHLEFRVEMTVRRGWRIPDDSIARSVTVSFLAPQTIAITAGKSAQLLSPGSMIPAGNSAGLMESLSGVAGTLDRFTADSLSPLVANLNRQVDTVGRILESVQPLIGNANTIMSSAADHVPTILAHVDQASTDLAAASSRVNQTLSPERLAALDRFIDNADLTAKSLQSTSADLELLTHQGGSDLRSGIADFRSAMDVFATRSDVIAGNLSSASRNFEEFSHQLRDNPGLLLRSPRIEDTAAPDPQ